MQRSVDLAAAARDREDLRAERTAAAAWRAQESTAEARVHAVLPPIAELARLAFQVVSQSFPLSFFGV